MSGDITALEMTIGGALGPPRYHRITTREGLAADVNKGKRGQVFLWYLKGAGDPIVDITVLYDDEPTPEGFTKLKRDITYGVDSNVFLAYRNAPAAEADGKDAISEIFLGYSPDDSPGAGWERVERPLNRSEEDGTWLWYRRGEEEDPDEDRWTPHKINVGDWFNVLDQHNNWCQGVALAVTEDTVRVRFHDFGKRLDEDIPKSMRGRFAQQGTHSRLAKPRNPKQGEVWRDFDADMADRFKAQIDDVINGPQEGEDPSAALARHTYFSTEMSPQATLIMRSAYPRDENDTIAELANSVLQRFHLLCIHYLQKEERMPKQVEEIFGRLFLSDTKCNHFFERFGACLPTTEWAAAVKGKYARIPNGGASRFFVGNMNWFGENGGFDAVLKRLQRTPPIEISELVTLIQALAVCKWCYEETFAHVYFRDVHEAIAVRLANLTDEELKDFGDTALNTLVLSLQGIYNVAMKDAGGGPELSDKLTLGFSNRLIRCETLNKRLLGARQLAKRVREAEQTRDISAAPAAGEEDGTGDWLTERVLCDWVLENQIVEVLLGGTVGGKSYGTHVELVKLMPPFFKFLAYHRALTRDHLSLLWSGCTSGGDHFRRAVYDLIAELAGIVEFELLDWIYEELIARIPLDELDDVAFRLVRGFTEPALARPRGAAAAPDGAAGAGADGDEPAADADGAEAPVTGSRYGIDLLFRLLQDGSGVSAETAAAAQATLVEILRLPDLRRYGRAALGDCIANVKKGTSVAQSLSLASSLITSLPGLPPRGSTALSEREEVLNMLEEEEKMVETVVTDITRYCAQAREAAAKRGAADSSTILVGSFTHADQLERRLSFLRLFVNGCDAEMSYDQLARLWAVLYDEPAVPADRDVFLEWVRAAADGEDTTNARRGSRAALASNAFSDDVTDRFFDDLLCSSEKFVPETCKMAGFAAFRYFFLTLNQADRKLRIVDIAEAHFYVASVEVRGIDQLWAIVMHAEDADVAAAASHLLVRLYSRVTASQSAEVWNGFVRHCMDRIKTASATAASGGEAGAAAMREVAGLMGLLSSFLSDVEATASPLFDLTVVHYQKGSHPSTMKLRVRKSTTVGNVRDMVAARVNQPANQIRLVTPRPTTGVGAGTQLIAPYDDRKTLDECRVKDKLQAMCLDQPEADTRAHEPTPMDDVETDRGHPREILSNSQEYFEQLFELLSLPDPSIVADVWELIQTLPVNEQIRRNIQTLQGTFAAGPSGSGGAGGGAGTTGATVDWKKLLDGVSTLRLLYSLQIVDRVVEPRANASDAEEDRRQAWCDAFVAAGGFAHLHSLLMAIDVKEAVGSVLSKRCMTLLLKLVNFFMVVPESFWKVQATKEFATELDFGAMVARLLQLVHDACHANPGPPPKSMEEAALPAPVKQLSPAELEAAKGTASRGMGTSTAIVATESGGAAESKDGEGKGDDGDDKGDEAEMTDEAEVVRYALQLLVAIVVQRRDVLASLYRTENVSATFLFSLLHSGDAAVRSQTSSAIDQLCTRFVRPEEDSDDEPSGVTPPATFFLDLLMDEVPQLPKYADRLPQFVGLAKRLLKDAGAGASATGGGGGPSGDGFDTRAPALVKQIASLIRTHPVIETNDYEQDFVLRALLQILTAILKRRPDLKADVGAGSGDDSLVDFLFDKGLFAMPTASNRGKSAPPLAKHPTTRKLAFQLLSEIARGDNASSARLCELVLPHHTSGLSKKKKKKKKKPSYYDYYKRDETKSSTGYVGLKNLGCICYMNASMQQFFNVPEFRKGLLMYDDQEEDKEESMMYQLQRLMAYLQESEKQYYNPKAFCHAFKDWGGEPTNVLVQKDASEFLGMLFQQIESKTMATEQEKLLKNVFGFTLSNELLADNHYSERFEPGQFVSVNVQNKKNLDEALLEYISGESVDYKWEEEDGKKVELPTRKRCSFKQLPPHLIIHLKRFEFDYTRMQQVKLNSFFEFPRELNMRPYTAEGRPDPAEGPAVERFRKSHGDGDGDSESKGGEASPAHPDEYYEYELMGCVVHTGTAESGHYYSFIRERDYGADPDNDTRRWLCFNDQWVSEWDDKELERECFGGEEIRTYGGWNGRGASTTRYERSRNAFVLFYDRKRPRLAKSVEAVAGGSGGAAAGATSAQLGGAVRAGTVASKMLARHRARKAMEQHRGIVPPGIFEEIWAENIEHWHRKMILDKNYFQFIWDLVTTTVPPPVLALPEGGVADEEAAMVAGGTGMTVIRLATLFIMQTLSQSKDKDALSKWIKKLKRLLQDNTVACVWLLQTMIRDRSQLREFLLENIDANARKSLGEILSYVVEQVAQAERDAYPAATASPILVREPSTESTTGEAGAAGAAAGEGKGESKDDSAAVAPAPSPSAFLAPPGQTVAVFVETLLDMLNDAADNWRAFEAYFGILNAFAAIGDAERQFLTDRGVIARLADFAMGPESPHPELAGYAPKDAPAGDSKESAGEVDSKNDVWDTHVHPPMVGPLAPGQSRITGNVDSGAKKYRPAMGDAYSGTRPKMEPVFTLLATLLFAHKSPSGSHTSPWCQVGEDGPELRPLDAEMVTCVPFFNTILQELTSFERARRLKPFVAHIVWEHAEVSDALSKTLGEEMSRMVHEKLKLVFRAASVLVGVDDSLRAARVDSLLTAITEAIHGSQRYYIETCRSIGLLIRLAMHHELVAAWCAENADKLEWMEAWVVDNPRQPYSNRGTVLSARPRRQGALALEPYDEAHTLQENLIRLRGGEELERGGYDSDDDPMSIVGKKIRVRWKHDKWYLGVVREYVPDTGEHYVIYVDGDKKLYRMSEKKFRVVPDEEGKSAEEIVAIAEAAREPAGGTATAGTGTNTGVADPDPDGVNDPDNVIFDDQSDEDMEVTGDAWNNRAIA